MIVVGIHTQYLATALRGLDAQREAHEHNIANVETPDFLAREVSFQDSLRQAMRMGTPQRSAITTGLSTDPTRPDGNNVRLDHELTALELNALQQNLMTEAINDQFGRIRAALGR